MKAQSLEIIPQANHTFGGKIYARFGDLKIQNSESYGLSLNVVNRNVSFQIEYFYQPTAGNFRYNETALSFGLQAGTNVYFSDRVGLRIHSRLNCPVQVNGFGFYAGTNSSGITVSAEVYFIQADFGIGLVVRFSK